MEAAAMATTNPNVILRSLMMGIITIPMQSMMRKTIRDTNDPRLYLLSCQSS